MTLLTIIQAQVGKLINEAEIFHLVLKGVLGLIGVVLTAIGTFCLWLLKGLIKFLKEYKATKEAETEAFKQQFSAIKENFYETDKVQMLHTEVLGTIKEKTKLLETKSEKHGRLLAEHGIEIKNLKRDAD